MHQEVCIGLRERSKMLLPPSIPALPVSPLTKHTHTHTLSTLEVAFAMGGFRLHFHASYGVYLLCLHCEPNAIHLSRWPIVFMAEHCTHTIIHIHTRTTTNTKILPERIPQETLYNASSRRYPHSLMGHSSPIPGRCWCSSCCCFSCLRLVVVAVF